MDNTEARVQRQKLYEEVWATPMQKLARQYGLSDRGLAKVCLRPDGCRGDPAGLPSVAEGGMIFPVGVV